MRNHRKWVFSIRVRRDRWGWLCRQFSNTDTYPHLAVGDTRKLRVYNCPRSDAAYIADMCIKHGEPFDIEYADRDFWFARFNEEGTYLHQPCGKHPDFLPPWVAQDELRAKHLTLKLIIQED